MENDSDCNALYLLTYELTADLLMHSLCNVCISLRLIVLSAFSEGILELLHNLPKDVLAYKCKSGAGKFVVLIWVWRGDRESFTITHPQSLIIL